MKLKLLAKSHHRNGLCGAPFNVFLFRDEDKTVKLAVDFGGDRFAVLDVLKLAKGDIAFGSNSWRGDAYASDIRKLADKCQNEVADGAFFVEYAIAK